MVGKYSTILESCSQFSIHHDHHNNNIMSTTETITDVDGTTPLWVWISLIAGTCASFWSQAAVTEER